MSSSSQSSLPNPAPEEICLSVSKAKFNPEIWLRCFTEGAHPCRIFAEMVPTEFEHVAGFSKLGICYHCVHRLSICRYCFKTTRLPSGHELGFDGNYTVANPVDCAECEAAYEKYLDLCVQSSHIDSDGEDALQDVQACRELGRKRYFDDVILKNLSAKLDMISKGYAYLCETDASRIRTATERVMFANLELSRMEEGMREAASAASTESRPKCGACGGDDASTYFPPGLHLCEACVGKLAEDKETGTDASCEGCGRFATADITSLQEDLSIRLCATCERNLYGGSS